jgi:hypothetical protein
MTFSIHALALPMSAGGAVRTIPSADEVVARMVKHDTERQADLHGYTAYRRYVLENRSRHAGWMLRTTRLRGLRANLLIVLRSSSGAATSCMSTAKHGQFWLPAEDRYVSDFGTSGMTEVRIEYFDYKVNDVSWSSTPKDENQKLQRQIKDGGF